MAKIKYVLSREILDSRGDPTIETIIETDDGAQGCAMVPSGASKGKKEALELRDNDDKRYNGKGVKKAVKNVNEIIASKIKGIDVSYQEKLDQLMINLDGTPKKSNLGANAILSVSLAICRAAADSQDLSLYEYIARIQGVRSKNFLIPTPQLNIINGGVHADNNLDIQEFMILPAGAKSFKEALRYGSEIFHALHEILRREKLSTGVGDEGGFSPNLASNREALEKIMRSIRDAGFEPGKNIFLALDSAANGFYKDGFYLLESGSQKMSSDGLINFYGSLLKNYPIISIEDPMAEDDKDGWEDFTNKFKNKLQIVGDDIFVTDPRNLNQGVISGIANSILIKPNQIGTLTETFSAIKLAQNNNYSYVVSHRSGETEDSFIADLSVGTNAGQIKTGSLSRSERICKYNRLMAIEIELGKKAIFAGLSTLPNYRQ